MSKSKPVSTVSRAAVIALTDQVRVHLATVAQTFWDIGILLARVRDEGLYDKLGYASFADYTSSEFRLQLRQVEKMVAIGRAYARADAVDLGVERSAALIGYAKLLRPQVDPGELARADATVGGRPVSACNVDDIRAATAALREERRLARGRAPDARRVASENKALVKAVHAFTKDAAIGRARVSIQRGEVVLRFPRAAFKARMKPYMT